MKSILALLISMITTHANDAILRALAAVESGADTPTHCLADALRGPRGECSRYQIMPAVWKLFAPLRSSEFTNPTKSAQVAAMVLNIRVESFRARRHRKPTPAEIYLLWHSPARVHKITPAAKRFANLYREYEKETKIEN